MGAVVCTILVRGLFEMLNQGRLEGLDRAACQWWRAANFKILQVKRQACMSVCAYTHIDRWIDK